METWRSSPFALVRFLWLALAVGGSYLGLRLASMPIEARIESALAAERDAWRKESEAIRGEVDRLRSETVRADAFGRWVDEANFYNNNRLPQPMAITGSR